MARIKRGLNTIKRRRKVMKRVKGFRAARRRNYRVANEAMLHALSYAFRDRRNRKRDFRSLWITRINAAARKEGISYSRLISGLKRAGISLNRKALAELAVTDESTFSQIIALAKAKVESPLAL